VPPATGALPGRFVAGGVFDAQGIDALPKHPPDLWAVAQQPPADVWHDYTMKNPQATHDPYK